MIKSDKKKEEPISDSENKTENIEKEADKLEVVQEKLLRTMEPLIFFEIALATTIIHLTIDIT